MPPEEPQAPEIGIGPAPTDPGTPEKEEQQDALFTPQAPTSEPAPPADAPESEDGPADTFDLDSVDFRRDKPEDIPEEHRAWFTKAQDEVRKAQGDRTREMDDLGRKQRELDQQAENLRKLESDLRASMDSTKTPAQQDRAEDRAQKRLKDLLSDPESPLDADTRKGLIPLANEIEASKADILSEVKDLIKEATSPLEQHVQASATTEQQRVHDGYVSQVNDAKGLYDDIDEYTPQILRTLGAEIQDGKFVQVSDPLTNPATGKPHTVQSAYELFTGKTQEAAKQARAEDADIRDKAKSKTPATPSTPAPAANGSLSRSEVLSEVRKARQQLGAPV